LGEDVFQQDLNKTRVTHITGGGVAITSRTIEDVKPAAAELRVPASSMNGVTLVVDGGLRLRPARMMGGA
jgi:hypothetical protein